MDENPTHGELESLDKAQCLANRASDGQIIHRDLWQYALGIYQIACAERDSLALDKAPVFTRYAYIAFRQQPDAQIGPEPNRSTELL
jgi:hypothetical protein